RNCAGIPNASADSCDSQACHVSGPTDSTRAPSSRKRRWTNVRTSPSCVAENMRHLPVGAEWREKAVDQLRLSAVRSAGGCNPVAQGFYRLQNLRVARGRKVRFAEATVEVNLQVSQNRLQLAHHPVEHGDLLFEQVHDVRFDRPLPGEVVDAH